MKGEIAVELIQILETAVNAVFPVVLMTLLGYVLKLAGFLTPEFIRVGSKLSFRVLMPCMLFINVYTIESFSRIQWDVVIYCVVTLLVIFFLGYFSAAAATPIPERRGVILQASFRSNTAIVGLSLASVLGGSEAVAVAAIVAAFSLPVMNILAVISLTIFLGGKTGKLQWKSILRSIATNPIILGIVAGMACLLIRGLEVRCFGRVVFALDKQLKFLYTAVSNVKSMASPFALLVLGAQFDFSASRGMLKEILVGTSWRVIFAPLIGICTAIALSEFTPLLNFDVNTYPALVALFGTPTAVSSAIMAGQMKNDEQLATQLVVWSSLCSVPGMFLTICLLIAGGFLAI